MIIGAVLASGTGSRMGSDIPKQFLSLCGKPIFIYGMEAFLKNPHVDSVVLCVSTQYLEYAKSETAKYIKTDKPVNFVTGGATRGQSLLNVLKFYSGNASSDDIILTHDAVRPFITDEIIDDSIEKCRIHGAAIACKKAVDTMFITDTDGTFIKSVPDRATVFHAQTPQTFYLTGLYEAIMSLNPEEFDKMTDAGSVYSYLNKPVAVSLGSEDNIKITYPGDLPTAEKILTRLNQCPHLQ